MFGKVNWILFNGQTGNVSRVEKFPFEIGSSHGADLRLTGTGLLNVHCTIGAMPGKGMCLQKGEKVHALMVNGKEIESEALKPNFDYLFMAGPNALALRGGNRLDSWVEDLDPNKWNLVDPENGRVEGPFSLNTLCRTARETGFNPDGLAHLVGMETGMLVRQILQAMEVSETRDAGTPPPPPPPGGPSTPGTSSTGSPPPPPPPGGPSAPGTSSTGSPPPPPPPGGPFSPGTSSTGSKSPLPPSVGGGDAFAPQAVATDKGNLTCPVCWLQFNPEDIMHIATHPDLKGDPVLGLDKSQRFLATRFDESNRALDPKGMPCTDIACPHCRRELANEFPTTRSKIFSVVGDASSGKSYYLAVLAKLLPAALFRELDVVLQDANPEGNAKLNSLRNTLFGANLPSQAIINKTALEGDMYEQVIRFERNVQMPFPFIYSLEASQHSEDRELVIFYDNAGEHFRPGIDLIEHPGAQHVAAAAGIIFLFDPFNSADFRAHMKDSQDPQIHKELIDQQDVILSEMKIRVHKLTARLAREKSDTPLAVVLGKCDGWEHALADHLLETGIIKAGEPPLRTDLFVDRRFNRQALEVNSGRLRQFLFDNCPTVVANAEAFSSRVKYFAISAFGHPPTACRDKNGEIMRSKDGNPIPAPDPSKLKPFLAEAPPLWILSEIAPELISSHP